jgi:hypothetical protein
LWAIQGRIIGLFMLYSFPAVMQRSDFVKPAASWAA